MELGSYFSPFEFKYNSSVSVVSFGALGFFVHFTLSSNSITVFQCASSSPVINNRLRYSPKITTKFPTLKLKAK